MREFTVTQFLLLTLAAAGAAKKSYEGSKIVRVQVPDDSAARDLSNMISSAFETTECGYVVDYWSDGIGVGGATDLIVHPDAYDDLDSKLNSSHLNFYVLVENVQEMMDQEALWMGERKKTFANRAEFDLLNYHRVEEIYEFFSDLEDEYDFVSTESIGRSFEGRDIKVLKICRGGCGNKPIVFIDGGIHANEWIGPSTVVYHVDKLVQSVPEGDEDLTEQLDWYFLPVVNPDGYEYTWVEDRGWRKTRHVIEGNDCVGVDANRNFDFHWDEGGVEYDSCGRSYLGPEPFSEPELQALRDFILANRDQIVFYQNLHQTGNFIGYPYAYTSDPNPDAGAQDRLATMGNEALAATSGEHYEVGCLECIVYQCSGIAVDWAYGAAGIKYSYTIELKDYAGNNIERIGEEIYAFHAAVARELISEYAL